MGYDFKLWETKAHFWEQGKEVWEAQYFFVIRRPPANEDGHSEHEHAVDLVVVTEGSKHDFELCGYGGEGKEHIERRWLCESFPKALQRVAIEIGQMHPAIQFSCME